MIKYLPFIRIFLWLGLAIFVIWLIVMAVVPGGQITYIYDFKNRSRFISGLTPKERVGAATAAGQKITGDPVYFTLYTPRPFRQATVTVTYRNDSRLPLLQGGVLLDQQLWRYDLQPLNNEVINDLAAAPEWGLLTDGATMLLQKNERYASVADFLARPPAPQRVAVYNYRLINNFRLPDYRPAAAQTIVNEQLRGAYQLYTYIKNENLDFVFTVSDLNQAAGADDFVATVSNLNGEVIKNFIWDDDGVSSGGKTAAPPRQFKIYLAALPEGVYKIDWPAGADIVTTTISTAQSKLVFGGKLWLSNPGRAWRLYTSGSRLEAQTANPDSLQALTIAGRSLALQETYRRVGADTACASEPCLISAARGDVTLFGNGVFAVTSAAWFDPFYKKLDDWPALAGVDYVVANYRLPRADGAWLQASWQLDLTRAWHDRNGYNFVLSVPALQTTDNQGKYLTIGAIKIDLVGKKLKDFWPL